MPQTTQIVPKYSFPYVETVINDYTLVANDNTEISYDTSIKQAYAVICPKGIDNVWVRKTSKSDAIKTYGDSNFKKYGQPYMQALNVLEQNNSSVWIMRVMPENATYANAFSQIGYRADTEADIEAAHKRKFRIKMSATSIEGINTQEIFKAETNKYNSSVDGEGYTNIPFIAVRYNGRGDCGNYYSLRISPCISYEKEYGIKMYNFEAITSESGLTKDTNYVASIVTSTKYEENTLIDDIIDDADTGVSPLDIRTNENAIVELYNAYITYLAEVHMASQEEYERKLDEFDVPEAMLNGTMEVTEEYEEQYKELKEIEQFIDETDEVNYPDIDEFDPIFGYQVSSTDTSIPGINFPTKLTDYIDTTSDDYDPLEYTTSNIISFNSVKGLILTGGTNGYFDNPRTVRNKDGLFVEYTFEDELTDCYKKAFNGTYDPKILSSRRIPINAFFDANYPYDVKMVIADLVQNTRNDCRVYLDTGIISSLSTGIVYKLIQDYSIFDADIISTDIHNYTVKEYSTKKKCNVTITYLLSSLYVYHLTNVGFHIPFVKGYCQLTGHVKDSLQPVIEEYNTDIKELLENNRLNYFECMGENLFQRAVQNTTQKANTDLVEESNSTILYTLKRAIERDAQDQLYNFADASTRKSFIEVEKAIYATWVGSILESFDIDFSTSEYEFSRSILHCYLSIVFRGLTKKVIIEIDINKRSYTTAIADETETDE